MVESNHVRDAGAQPGITAGGAVARKLPRKRQGENPHAGQPVALARAQGGQTAARAQGPAAAGWDLAEAFEITRSLPHGHVAAVLGTAEKLGMAELIDPAPSRNRDLVCAMLAAPVIAPGSKLAIARGLRTETATSSLGAGAGRGRL